ESPIEVISHISARKNCFQLLPNYGRSEQFMLHPMTNADRDLVPALFGRAVCLPKRQTSRKGRQPSRLPWRATTPQKGCGYRLAPGK
ncbi:MAG TPA: hypothetical protein VNW92_23150, partial [Polyangiaceae bacterium]|nr:hypothetical protein [Polyangiaceae bacterium]